MNYEVANNWYNIIKVFPHLPFLFIQLNYDKTPQHSFLYTVPGLISEQDCAVLGIRRNIEQDWFYGWEQYLIDSRTEAGQRILSSPKWEGQCYGFVDIHAPYGARRLDGRILIYPALMICMFAGKPVPIPESWIQKGV